MSETVVTASALQAISAQLEGSAPEEIIRWAHGVFGRRLAVLSAMQKAGSVVCQMVSNLGLQNDIDILFVDTGVNFHETYDTIERMRHGYGLNIISLHPERTMAQQTADEGVLYLTRPGQERCCTLRKKEPLKQIVGKYDAMIGSLRRAEGGKRATIPVLSIDAELKHIRVHPIFSMTDEQLESLVVERQTIINPLHNQGYPTISCDRCTTPVVEGEDKRAGRWRHLQNSPEYCAINPTDRSKRAGAPEESVTLDAAVAAKLLAPPALSQLR
ncbi:phosphoadenylyl-sulfate reductase [soil metagenome]